MSSLRVVAAGVEGPQVSAGPGPSEGSGKSPPLLFPASGPSRVLGILVSPRLAASSVQSLLPPSHGRLPCVLCLRKEFPL